MSLATEANLLLAAVQTLTRIPVRVDHEPDTVRRAVRYMPLVGLGIGAAAAAAFTLARTGLPVPLAAILAVAFVALLTGALHEDGLADCCDGTGGRTREDVLRIMRDSRIGTYGTLALVLTVATRIAALSTLSTLSTLADLPDLPDPDPVSALVAAAGASRFWAVLSPALLPYARAEGTGGTVASPARADLVIAAAFGLGVPLLLLGPRAVPALLLSALAALGVIWWARRRIGGYTGDVLGAVQQLSELVILLAVLWHPA